MTHKPTPWRRLTPLMLLIGLLALSAATVHGGQHKTSSLCTKVRKAVQAGHTMDQIIAECDTDAEHVMKCMQSKGHRKKTKAEKKSTDKHGKGTGSTSKSDSATSPAAH